MRHINFKKIILVLGIIIVLNLFFNYGIKTFYNEPKYDNYCPQELQSKQYNTKEDCENVGGMWQERTNVTYEQDLSMPAPVPVPSKEAIASWCDSQYTCRKDFESVYDLYKRNVFIIWVIVGVVSLILGFSIAASEAVSLGLSFGGLVSLIVGTIGYWSAMNDYLRFIILGIALAILVWIGIKKMRNEAV